MAILYNSNYDLTVPFSDVCAQIHLTANTDESFTVPGNTSNQYSMRLSYISTTNVFVRVGGAPTIPGANTVGTEAYNEFRPGADGSQRYVKGGDVIHFTTPDAVAYVGVRLMSLMSPG